MKKLIRLNSRNMFWVDDIAIELEKDKIRRRIERLYRDNEARRLAAIRRNNNATHCPGNDSGNHAPNPIAPGSCVACAMMI